MSDVPAAWWSPTEGVLAADQAQSYVWKDDLPSDAVRLAPAATPAALSDRFREATAAVERVRDDMTTHPGAYAQVIDALTLLTRWLAADPEDPVGQAVARALEVPTTPVDVAARLRAAAQLLAASGPYLGQNKEVAALSRLAGCIEADPDDAESLAIARALAGPVDVTAEIAWHVAQLRQDRAGLAPDDSSRSDAARAYQQGWRDAYDQALADLTARAAQRAATPTTDTAREG